MDMQVFSYLRLQCSLVMQRRTAAFLTLCSENCLWGCFRDTPASHNPYLFISNFSIAKKKPPATIRKSKKATSEYLSYSAKKTNLSEIRIKKRRALILNYDVVNIISSGEVPLDLRLEL